MFSYATMFQAFGEASAAERDALDAPTRTGTATCTETAQSSSGSTGSVPGADGGDADAYAAYAAPSAYIVGPTAWVADTWGTEAHRDAAAAAGARETPARP